MIAFFLGTTAGRLILGFVIASGVALGAFVYGDAHGRGIAHAADAAKLTACVDANASNQATIAQLKAANVALAASVRASKGAEAKAKADVAAAQKTAQNALQRSHKAVQHVYDTNPSAKQWGATGIPTAIASILQ